MPKVSEAHLEARRRQILEAALACFAERGFHATSMRDICREAKLSAGAVYRYFASKEALIAGMVIAEVEPMMAEIQALEPEDRIRAIILGSFDRPDLDREIRVELSLWAEALTNPRIAELMISQVEPLTATLTEAISALQQSGRIRDPNPAPVLAQRVQGGLLGGMLQLAVIPNFDIHAYLAAIAYALLGAPAD
ncbi:transcriptional regulatory protein [Plesiocystis pacifica SIR-1]|uniref:Transcriptional regulatory protein n=1 Tax=Plesiocystis pacifica SIR-1 TaxID=391625 RepID=A6G1H6_9BACT|nr:TetR family transcriptional regulator [Plesiocystis pacifica]EDM80240.1 transcriptional regulatory protein [Plesiocystis pacifica SIR-1]